jgi:hypothetical protein
MGQKPITGSNPVISAIIFRKLSKRVTWHILRVTRSAFCAARKRIEARRANSSGALRLLAINHFVVRFVFKHRLPGQMPQATPTVLTENGRARRVSRDEL